MRFLLLLSIFLASCSTVSPAPTQYARGTFIAPPPAPARPGVGLPAVGDPGTQQKEYPRSPYTRVLPPTREPGLWASDQPKAIAMYHGAPSQYGYTFTLPIAPDATDVDHAYKCAQSIRRAGDYLGYSHSEVAMLSLEERECMLARVFLRCTTTAEHRAKDFVVPEDAQLKWRNLRVAAQDEVQKRCFGEPPVERTTRGRQMEEALMAKLAAVFRWGDVFPLDGSDLRVK